MDCGVICSETAGAVLSGKLELHRCTFALSDNPASSPHFKVQDGGKVNGTDTNFENFGMWFDGEGTRGELVRCIIKCSPVREAPANVVVREGSFVSITACIVQGGSNSIAPTSLGTTVLIYDSVLEGADTGVLAMDGVRVEQHGCVLQNCKLTAAQAAKPGTQMLITGGCTPNCRDSITAMRKVAVEQSNVHVKGVHSESSQGQTCICMNVAVKLVSHTGLMGMNLAGCSAKGFGQPTCLAQRLEHL